MKKFMTIIAISALFGTPVLAQEHEHMPGHDMTHMEGGMHGEHMGHAAEDGEREAMPSVRQVEASKVCMVNIWLLTKIRSLSKSMERPITAAAQCAKTALNPMPA